MLELCKNPSSAITMVFELLIGLVFKILALEVTDEILTAIIELRVTIIKLKLKVLLKFYKHQKAAAIM